MISRSRATRNMLTKMETMSRTRRAPVGYSCTDEALEAVLARSPPPPLPVAMGATTISSLSDAWVDESESATAAAFDGSSAFFSRLNCMAAIFGRLVRHQSCFRVGSVRYVLGSRLIRQSGAPGVYSVVVVSAVRAGAETRCQFFETRSGQGVSERG